jgi:hypothetical protein
MHKLARVPGLLGSAFDGEVVAAARAAEMIRRQMGASWSDLLRAPPPDRETDPQTLSAA